MDEAAHLRVSEEITASWASGHIYYHEDLERVVLELVRPLLDSLVKERQVDAFFFIRYGLGGPHVRLRLRATAGGRDQVLEAMQRAAERFLDLAPSTRSIAEEAIRRSNESSDPQEIDDSIQPDNSFRVVPFRPEIERYGGPHLFQASLDFFTLSTVAVLELLAGQGRTPRPARLADAFCMLLEQALGFAMDATELSDLLRYGVDSMGSAVPNILEKADRVARSQRDVFLELYQRSVAAIRPRQTASEPSRPAMSLLVAGSRRLSAAIGFTDRTSRAWIGGSQLHMTASRLGLGNVEEVYLSRLLTAQLAEVRAGGDENLSWLEEKRATASPSDAEKTLGDLLAPALAALTDLPPSQVAPQGAA